MKKIVSKLLQLIFVFASTLGQAMMIMPEMAQEYTLDDYSTVYSAHSVRRTRRAYSGPLMRVRRSTDNAEQDIYYTVSGFIDQNQLESFCSATNCFVTNWYDQSSNAFDAEQVNSTEQPRMVNSGSADTNSIGFVSLKFDGSTDNLTITNGFDLTQLLGYGLAVVESLDLATNPFNAIFDQTDPDQGWALFFNDLSGTQHFGRFNATLVATQSANGILSTGVTYLTSAIFKSGNSFSYLDGVQVGSDATAYASAAANGQTPKLGADGAVSGRELNGYLAEVITFVDDRQSTRAAIEASVNRFYGVY